MVDVCRDESECHRQELRNGKERTHRARARSPPNLESLKERLPLIIIASRNILSKNHMSFALCSR